MGAARSALAPSIESDAGAGLPNGRWRPAELVFWALPVIAFFVLPDYRVLGSQILIAALFALSLDLILGYAGIVSLGHAAFFGIGAYTAGLLAVQGWGEPITGLMAAAIVSALSGYLVSLLVVRGSDLTRLMVTLGVGVMFWELANRASSITGGVDRLSGVAVWKIFGLFNFDIGGRTAYLYSLVVLFAMFVVARRIVNSPLGLSVRGIREGPKRMPAIGAPVARRLRTIFTVAAAFAGVAGALLAQTSQFVGIDTLGFARSGEVLVMLVLGGAGRLYGGLIGAAIYMVAHDYLAGVSPVYWQLGIGLLLIAVVMLAHGGVLGGVEAFREWMHKTAR